MLVNGFFFGTDGAMAPPALTHCVMVISDEKNPKLKDLIRAKVEEYLDRAEKLKDHIQSTEDQKKQAVGSNGKTVGGGGGGAVKCAL